MDLLKRGLALTMCLLFCFGFITCFAFAEEAEQEGLSDPGELEEVTVAVEDVQEQENAEMTEGLEELALPGEAEEAVSVEEPDVQEPESIETTEESEIIELPDVEQIEADQTGELVETAEGQTEDALVYPEETAGIDEENIAEPERSETELILTEEFNWNDDMLIDTGFVAYVIGSVRIPQGVTVTVYGTLVVEEQGVLTVAGKLLFEDSATVEGNVQAIVAVDDGSIEGLEKFMAEPEETGETEEFLVLTWEDILSAGVFCAEEPIMILEDAVIPKDAILQINGGELTIAPEASLTVEGILQVTNGTLTVSDGALLKNDMSILVEEQGALNVEGSYLQADTATLTWDDTGEGSLVQGVEWPLIDRIIVEEDISMMNEYLTPEGFRTVTVTGSAVIPEDAILAISGGELTIAPEASLTVEGMLQVTNGILTVSEGALLENDMSILVKEQGVLKVEGSYTQADTATLTWDDTEDGTLVEGVEWIKIDKIVSEPDASTLNAFLSPEGFRTVTVTGNVVIPEEEILVLQSGALTIAPEASLTLGGLLQVSGGTLTVSEGALLNNNLFILVEEEGALKVEGSYEQAETAALIWDATEDGSLVEGIEKTLIEKIVFAADASTLNAFLSADGFRMVTVLVSSADLVNAVSAVPDGVIICQR